jgi:hypothetical protein
MPETSKALAGNRDKVLHDAVCVRMKRLLHGDMNPQEVAFMFADLRFLKGCPAEIHDLPDFAAHRPTKEKGHTFDATNKLFGTLEAFLSGRVPTFTACSGFSDVGVVKHLRSFLLVRNIFRASELPVSDMLTLLRPVALYALASMHGCELRRKDGSTAILAIRESLGVLEIGCTDQMPTAVPEVKANLRVFSTSLSIDAAIGRLKSGFPHSDPDVTIEMTSDGHLRYLE